MKLTSKYSHISRNEDNEALFLDQNSDEINDETVNSENSKDMNKASWFSMYISIASTILGAGILGIPYAFSRCGWILGTILLFIGAFSTIFGFHLLSVCGKYLKNSSSFHDVAELCFPGSGSFVDFAIALKCISITVSYLLVIGDSMPKALHQLSAPSFLQNRSTCLFLGFAVLAPLSYMERLDYLKYSSLISGIFILFLVFLVVLFSIGINDNLLDPCSDSENHSSCVGTTSFFILNEETLSVLSIFALGYGCQQNTFTVVNELQNPTQSRINNVIYAAAGTALILNMLIALCAYSTYGDKIDSDILTMYPETSLTSFCRISMSFVVACHFPLQLHPARNSLISLVLNYYKNQGDSGNSNEPIINFEISKNISINLSFKNFLYYLITTIHLASTLTIALIFSDLGVVLEVAGATGSTMVIFLLPGYFYYTLSPSFGDIGEGKLKRNAALIMATLGCLFIPFFLVFIFINAGK